MTDELRAEALDDLEALARAATIMLPLRVVTEGHAYLVELRDADDIRVADSLGATDAEFVVSLVNARPAFIARLRAAERVVEAGQRLLGVLAEDDEPYWWRGEASNLREALAALAETLP